MKSSPEYYKDLDISLAGKPTGIEPLTRLPAKGICYHLINRDSIIKRVDVYQDSQLVHYKIFGYDDQGRVIENTMYTPDSNGGWHIVDDIWYYQYDPSSGLRSHKIMKLPGVTTATKISYDAKGNRLEEAIIAVASPEL